MEIIGKTLAKKIFKKSGIGFLPACLQASPPAVPAAGRLASRQAPYSKPINLPISNYSFELQIILSLSPFHKIHPDLPLVFGFDHTPVGAIEFVFDEFESRLGDVYFAVLSAAFHPA